MLSEVVERLEAIEGVAWDGVAMEGVAKEGVGWEESPGVVTRDTCWLGTPAYAAGKQSIHVTASMEKPAKNGQREFTLQD